MHMDPRARVYSPDGTTFPVAYRQSRSFFERGEACGRWGQVALNARFAWKERERGSIGWWDHVMFGFRGCRGI